MDQAQKFLEDVLTEDPKNNDALELMAGINLQTAFRSIAAEGGDKYEVLERIRTALVSAAEKRRKVLDSRFDAVGAVTESNLMAYCDEAIRSSRYWAAISALQQRFLRDPSNSAVSNRLAYSQLRSSKIQDAYTTLTTVKRKAALDAYGYGLLAVIEAAIGNNAASDDAIREAILSDSEDMGMRTAQVFVALNRGKLGAMGDLVSGLQRDAGQRPEVNYYLATLLYMQQNYSDAEKRFQKAVLADPCLYDMYIQRANEALRSVVSENLSGEAAKYRFAVAKAYFDAALAAKADSPEALTGVALANVLQSKPGECLKYARAAVAANPSYAAGQYTLAMVGSAVSNDLQTKAEQIRNEDKDGILDAEQKKQMADLQRSAKDLKSELRKAYEAAQKLDKVLNGSQIPNTFDAFQYYYRFGRLPLLTMPK